MAKVVRLFVCVLMLASLSSCQRDRQRSQRQGSEIVAAGQRFDIGAPVVLWTDAGGYNAYAPAPGEAKPKPRFGTRSDLLPPAEAKRVERDGWDLPTLQRVVDQFVIHYDGTGVSRETFRVLNKRGLSCHFLLDLDGTIYQTLDLQERAWHATTSNSRSIGIEIANVGAFEVGKPTEFGEWYHSDDDPNTPPRIKVPKRLGDGGVRTRNFRGRPATPGLVVAEVQGKMVRQYDLTEEQYASLVKLTAALCRIFPNLPCDYPRDGSGGVATRKLPDAQLRNFRGVIGHYHIQTNKVDPGPAFQWDRLIRETRRELAR